MGIISGILSKIKSGFKGGKKEDETIDLLREIFGQNFLFITGERADVSLTRIRTEEFEKHPSIKQSGFLSAGLSGSEQPGLILFYPADSIRMLLPVIKEKHPAEAGGGDAAAVLKAMDWIMGGIGRLFRPEENNPGATEPVDFLFLKKQYIPADKDGLLWQASGCAILNITAGQFAFFLLVNEDTENIFRNNLKDKAFRKAAWKLAQSAYLPDAPLPINNETAILRLKKPKEFIAGNSLIPQTAAFDRFRIKSVFKHITAHGNPGGSPVRDGLWIRISLTAGGSETGIYYLIAGVSRNDFTEKFGDPANLFKNFMREVMLFLKANCPSMTVSSMKIAMDLKPDEATLAKCISVNGELLVNYSRMEIAVYAPRSYFALLYPSALKPWEYRLTGDSPRGTLAAILSLNMSFFNRNIASFMKRYRSGLAYMPAATTCIPLYEFMDLLDDRDLRILMQNLLVPKYSSGIARLFNIGIPVKKDGTVPGKKSLRVLQVAYDRERINQMIPPIIMEEIDRKVQYIMADEFDSFNKEILKEITKAITVGRISISYKTRYILMHEIYDIINEEESKRLMDLRSKGIPFSNLNKLPKNRMINFVNKIGNNDLCKSVIDLDEEKAILLTCMSRSRKRQFTDDLEYFRREYVNTRITTEEIISIKLKINNMLDKEIKSRRDMLR